MSSHKKKPQALQESPTKNTLIYGIILIFCFILYGNSIPNNYALDDIYVITGNKYTKQGLSGVGSLLTKHYFAGYFGDNKVIYLSGGRYRPLFLVTFAIEYSIFGQNPHISHLINILLYALTGILLYLLLKKLLVKFQERRRFFSIPFLAVMLFLAHPVHTEVVTNIKGRDEILSVLFSLLAFWFSLKYLEKKTLNYLVFSFLSFFVAMMSKESAITFVLIIPLGIYFFTDSFHWKNFRVFIPLILAAVTFLLIRQWVLAGEHYLPTKELMDNPFIQATHSQKYATILLTFGMYIKLLFIPYPLTWDYYPYHIQLVDWNSWKAIMPMLIYSLLFITAIIGLKRKKLYSFGILLYFIGLSLASNILFPIGTFMAERYLYIPSMGFCLIAGWFFAEKFPPWFKGHKTFTSIPVVLMILVLSIFSIETIARNPVWKDDYTLYTTDVETSANSARGNSIAGQWYAYMANRPENQEKREEFLEKAFIHLKKAVAVHPTYQDALFNLGNVYYDYKHDLDSVLYCYYRILHLDPNEEHCYQNIDLIMRSVQDSVYKRKTFETLLRINPKRYEPNLRLGILLCQHEPARAVKYLENAIAAQPQDTLARYYLRFIKK